MTRRRHNAFTLIELLTVAFIIAIMVAMILPAIQNIRKTAMVNATKRYMDSIRDGIVSYRQDFPGTLPPSEPDIIGAPWAGNTSYYGGYALMCMLNGWDGASGNTIGAAPGGGSFNRYYPARVQNVPVKSQQGFTDYWGNVIDYFVAYKDRTAWHSGWPRGNAGDTCADVYPRACNAGLSGSGDYNFPYDAASQALAGTTHILLGGRGLHVSVVRWLNGFGPDATDPAMRVIDNNYPANWQYNSVPVNVGGYIMASTGADGLFGTSDDVGDVTPWGN